MNEPAKDAEAIFLAALERPTPRERAAFIEGACAGSPDLLHRLRELLASHEESRGPLDAPPPGLGITADLPPIAERPGMQVGPYKLLQQIGEGGFGVVFMAEQTAPVRRMVALKIIKPGMDTAQVIARFESERQALALMEHPNIARVLDAGTTGEPGCVSSGRPYFVMELVKGMPITDYCDKNQLAPEARLGLFLEVCRAIQHAHHKGVIHRDVKPSNVLVTLHDGVPVVKVIDFGVAKATGLKLTERTLFTAYGQMIGTPAYMSPEQAEMSGLDIDTRSDVYALGVLLYELLTGTTPLEAKRLREAAYAEVQRLIREEEAPRPSTRLSSLMASRVATAPGVTAEVLAGNRGLDVKRLVHMLAGDLDWLVMKALEKDRNRRYGTPASFAEDVERYLRGEVIEARPPSTAYKLKKFAQRNRAAVLTTMVVAASLILGIILASWQATRALAAEEQATEALAQAETDRDAARQALAAERLAQAQITKEKERAEKALADAASERNKVDDLIKTALLLQFLKGAMDAEQQGAYELAERQYQSAREVFRTRQGTEMVVRIYRKTHELVPIRPGAENETEMVTLALCRFYGRRNTPEKGEQLLRELLVFHKQHPDPKEKVVGSELLPPLGILGLNLLQQRKWADAEMVLRECLEIYDRLYKSIRQESGGHYIPPIGWNVQLMIGQSLVGQRKYKEAEHYLTEGYKGGKELLDAYKGFGGDTSLILAVIPVRETVERLVQLYEAWDRPDEAARWRKELEAIKTPAPKSGSP